MMTDTANPVATAAAPAEPLHVQVLCFPDAILGTVFTTLDVLRLAASILKMRAPHAPCPLTWRTVGPDGEAVAFDHAAPGLLASPPPEQSLARRTLIVVPALHAANALELPIIAGRHGPMLDRLKAHVAQGGLLAVCSTGLIFPALLGMLDGLRLDAHWAFKSFFARLFPACDFSAPDTMSFHPQLYTCVAPAQQTELMIAALERLLSADVSQNCAQLFQPQPGRQQLGNQLVENDWLSLTADSPVYRAKRWLETHVEQPYSLKTLAQVASASERTLLRHFRTVLGATPLDYLHGLRVQRATMMLEVSISNMQTIALACGYSDASTFGKLFQRAMHMSPGEYRKHHTLRTKRAHWRVEPEV
jgi:transcriptional regulator GlxA family with amidase domain